jgi:glycosyltransferase involved in cell wall biosynthesis
MRVLIAALPGSPHVIRHANLLADAGIEVHVAPVLPLERDPALHPAIEFHDHPAATTPPGEPEPVALARRTAGRTRTMVARSATRLATHLGLPPTATPPSASSPLPLATIGDARLRDALQGNGIDAIRTPGWLAELIDALRPDILVSSDIIQSGLLTHAARTLCTQPLPRWLIVSLGIDLHWYPRIPNQRRWILKILAAADALFAECERDIGIARALGFRGLAPCVAPIGGGWDVARMTAARQPGPTEARRAIAIKGYGGPVGRGVVAIAALRLAADVLDGVEIGVFSAHPDVELAAQVAAADTGLDISIWPRLPYEDLIARFGRCRAIIGLSESDGLATTAIEAILAGAVPIQSDTSCVDEWIEPGETGLLVPANDPAAVADALRRAMTDDAFVELAVAVNDRMSLPELDAAAVNPRIVDMYRKIAAT